MEGNGCNLDKASCDIEYVANAVYGCGGNVGSMANPGIPNGVDLCGTGYSICNSFSDLSNLNLTKTVCENKTPVNKFYASLIATTGNLNCNDSQGTNDVML